MNIFSDSDDDLNFILNIKPPRERKFCMRTDFLKTLHDDEFKNRFRISKNSFRILLEEINFFLIYYLKLFCFVKRIISLNRNFWIINPSPQIIKPDLKPGFIICFISL